MHAEKLARSESPFNSSFSSLLLGVAPSSPSTRRRCCRRRDAQSGGDAPSARRVHRRGGCRVLQDSPSDSQWKLSVKRKLIWLCVIYDDFDDNGISIVSSEFVAFFFIFLLISMIFAFLVFRDISILVPFFVHQL